MNIKACNRDLYDTIKYYCLEGVPLPRGVYIGSSNYLELITSQDKPQLQSPPIVMSLNSSSIQVRVYVPAMPNGIVLLFEIWSTAVNVTKAKSLVCLIDDLYDPNDYE